MSVLSDQEIKDLAAEGMIAPFSDRLVSERDGIKLLSYGLSSYGYDIRLSPSQCLLFVEYSMECVMPKTLTRRF